MLELMEASKKKRVLQWSSNVAGASIPAGEREGGREEGWGWGVGGLPFMVAIN